MAYILEGNAELYYYIIMALALGLFICVVIIFILNKKRKLKELQYELAKSKYTELSKDYEKKIYELKQANEKEIKRIENNYKSNLLDFKRDSDEKIKN